MKRIIGHTGKEKKTKKKPPPKRLIDQPSSAYEFAVNEFHQTVKPTQSNDAGLLGPSTSETEMDMADRRQQSVPQNFVYEQQTTTPHHMSPIQEQPSMNAIADNHNNTKDSNYQEPKGSSPPSMDACGSSLETPYFSMSSSSPESSQQQYSKDRTTPTDEMYAMYEETYGDAYVGAPLKYIYPTGYQTMRPRGGPWKLSIAICVLFTWLSVFIVGHCSDRAAAEEDDQNNSHGDDDEYVIATRWCGSRLLYFVWIMSMLTTGLAAAYCSVIGYIKLRDFAVANLRSQPTGTFGQSDYYVTIEDNQRPSRAEYYKKTIYQSNGEPQFWGNHIYRPTQAAVAVTSR